METGIRANPGSATVAPKKKAPFRQASGPVSLWTRQSAIVCPTSLDNGPPEVLIAVAKAHSGSRLAARQQTENIRGEMTMKSLVKRHTKASRLVCGGGPYGRSHHRRGFCNRVDGLGGCAEPGPREPGSGLFAERALDPCRRQHPLDTFQH